MTTGFNQFYETVHFINEVIKFTILNSLSETYLTKIFRVGGAVKLLLIEISNSMKEVPAVITHSESLNILVRKFYGLLVQEQPVKLVPLTPQQLEYLLAKQE